MERESTAVVVLSALGVEIDAVCAHLDLLTVVRHPTGTLFDVGTLRNGGQNIALAETGVGNCPAAVIAERAMALFRPSALIFVGVAGSLRPHIGLGDVVVGTRIYGYHGGREDPDGFMGSPRCWEAPHGLTQLAGRVARMKTWSSLPGVTGVGPRVHFGAIASGDVVLNNPVSSVLRHIRRSFNDAVAIEMESVGLAYAGHLNGGLPTLTVRAISDSADGGKARADAAGWQARAAGNAAAFACALVSMLEPKSRCAP